MATRMTKNTIHAYKKREPGIMMSKSHTGFPWKTVLGTTAVAGATAWYFLRNRGDVREFVRDHLGSEEKERTKRKRHYNDYKKNDYSETYSGAY